MDFVCPFTQGRQILNPDYIIFMDTTEKGRYADNNKPISKTSQERSRLSSRRPEW